MTAPDAGSRRFCPARRAVRPRLVTFLLYRPDDLVLVVRIPWLREQATSFRDAQSDEADQ